MSDAIIEWLSTDAANDGLTYQAQALMAPETREKLASLLKNEEAYQVFANVILSPEPCDDPELSVARSWRALQVLSQDLALESQGGTSRLINATRAALLTKQVFKSLSHEDGVLIHKRALLDSLLDAYPSSVVSAACAGGKEGLEAHLQPMMLPRTCSQTLPTLTSLVLYGCTGRSGKTSAEHRPMMQQPSMATKKACISNGHRRKFVRSLADWNLLEHLVQCIAHGDDNASPIGLGEEACETLLTIVECVGYPHPEQPTADTDEQVESVGEETLLTPLGQPEWWNPLVSIIAQPALPMSNDTARVAAARAIVGIFGLATGRSSRIRRAAAPAMDATDEVETKMELEESENTAADNKLRDWGLTTKIHRSLVLHLSTIVKALEMDEALDREKDFQATVYIRDGEDPDLLSVSAVPHPGRCRIIPFTSWRLQIVNLLAELLSYDDESKDKCESESPRCAAMNALIEFPMEQVLLKDNEETTGDDSATNPWPALCDWVFQYPENSLYHIQFLRLFQAICLEHHEPTLRLVLQKSKFVSRAVRTCRSGGPLRGALLNCLNILRLRSQSLAPSAFLRQFLESHDAWKSYQDDLLMTTMAQQWSGLSIPGQEMLSVKEPGLGLGSPFASHLGFDGIREYEQDESFPAVKQSTSGYKKKKKMRKKKKTTRMKESAGSDDDSEGRD